MPKQIAITTRLVTRIDNEEEIIEQAVDGLLDIGPENHMLRFTEQDQQTQVHLLVSEERAQLRRNGSFSSAMRFTQGGRFESTYQTPHGPLQMHVVTKQYHTKHDTEGGTLETAYELYLFGRFISHNPLLLPFPFSPSLPPSPSPLFPFSSLFFYLLLKYEHLFLHRRATAAMRPDSADAVCSLRHHSYYLRLDGRYGAVATSGHDY